MTRVKDRLDANLNLFLLTDHLSLIVDHHSQVVEDLVHIHNVGLERTGGRGLTIVTVLHCVPASVGYGWYLHLFDVSLFLLDDIQVLLCDGGLQGLALTPLIFPTQ